MSNVVIITGASDGIGENPVELYIDDASIVAAEK